MDGRTACGAPFHDSQTPSEIVQIDQNLYKENDIHNIGPYFNPIRLCIRLSRNALEIVPIDHNLYKLENRFGRNCFDLLSRVNRTHSKSVEIGFEPS